MLGSAAYRAWEQKIAGAQAQAKGFQRYRFEPPIPGVQESWRLCDSPRTQICATWMNSPVRLNLLKEAEPFTEEIYARIVRAGFDFGSKSRAERLARHLEEEHAGPADALSGGVLV